MSAVDSLNKKMLRMEKQINNIDQAVTKNTNDIKSTDKKLENVQKEVDTLKETIESNPVQEEVFKEINEREIRKSNIVLYNIREPEGETAETRKAEDTDEVRNIFKVINNKVNTETEVKFMYRIGEKEKNSDNSDARPRPLLIGFKKSSSAENILSNCKNLKNSDFDSISVVPDLTQRQRKGEQLMREEVQKRNEDRTEEESENWEYRMLGPRGQRKIVKCRINAQEQRIGEDRSTQGQTATRGQKRKGQTSKEKTTEQARKRLASST